VAVHVVKGAENSSLLLQNAERQLALIQIAFEAAGIGFSDGRVTVEFKSNEGKAVRRSPAEVRKAT